MEQITTTSEGPYIRQENRSSETKPTARSQQLYCQHTNHLWNTEQCHTAVAMGWQHTEPGTSSHPVAPVPVCGWHRQEGHRDRRDTGTGGMAEPGAGQEISPCRSHCWCLSPMWLPVPSQGPEHCIQPQQGDYSEPGMCLESHHPHSLLSVSCPKHRSHHSPIFQTHFGTGQLLWTFFFFFFSFACYSM